MISRYEHFSFAISRIYHDIQHIERVEMEKFGLKGPHAQCLVAMSRNPEGITAGRLCKICDKDKAAISRTVAELEQKDLLSRSCTNGNRYRALLKLTERGRAAAGRVNERIRIAAERAGEGLSDAQRSAFYGVLGIIGGNLQKICSDGLAD